ncbi:hypothetical protein [Streptomyces sp. TM32]|nr:hypothetical protein [Streptomyces sp. TM32]
MVHDEDLRRGGAVQDSTTPEVFVSHRKARPTVFGVGLELRRCPYVS